MDHFAGFASSVYCTKPWRHGRPIFC